MKTTVRFKSVNAGDNTHLKVLLTQSFCGLFEREQKIYIANEPLYRNWGDQEDLACDISSPLRGRTICISTRKAIPYLKAAVIDEVRFALEYLRHLLSEKSDYCVVEEIGDCVEVEV